MRDNVFVLNDSPSIANHFLRELRDVSTQKDRMRFRRNMERLGEMLAYEVSKKLSYGDTVVTTPLGKSRVALLRSCPLLIAILRAGIPFHQGFLNYFDQADCGFIGAYRAGHAGEVKINVDYLSIPSPEKRDIILIDPMLATGRSVLDAVNVLLNSGTPSHVHVVSVVAAPEGLAMLQQNLSVPHSLWTCAVDEKLNDTFYIVPGLGDAGDLSYGEKL